MKSNKIYTPETPITLARRARKANNIPKKFQYHDPTKFAWLRNPKIVRGIAGTVVLVSLCFIITIVAVTMPTKNRGATSLLSTSIGKQDETNTSTTDENNEPTTTEAITLKSFSGSLRIISDVYTDSLANSNSSEYTSKSATHEAMVIFSYLHS